MAGKIGKENSYSKMQTDASQSQIIPGVTEGKGPQIATTCLLFSSFKNIKS